MVTAEPQALRCGEHFAVNTLIKSIKLKFGRSPQPVHTAINTHCTVTGRGESMALTKEALRHGSWMHKRDVQWPPAGSGVRPP